MAYVIEHRNTADIAGLYARVQRASDDKYWDDVADGWITPATTDCDISLTEGDKGVYNATIADLSPAKGEIYNVEVYNSADTLLQNTEDPYDPDRKTTLEIINQIQRGLRLPESAALTTSHAKLLLTFLNELQDTLMIDGDWPELKLKLSQLIISGQSKVTIYPTNTAEVDIIKRIQVGTDIPLFILNDREFLDIQRTNSGSSNQPTQARVLYRIGGALVVEVDPVPDAAYTLVIEALQKPAELVNQGDIPILDTNTLIQGVLAKAKDEQGTSPGGAFASFLEKLNGGLTSQQLSSYDSEDE